MQHDSGALADSRCLVTGGAGFVGSHLVDFLLAAGARVDVLDDFSTGSRANLSHLESEAALTIAEGSVTDPDLVHPLVTDSDVVFHLAASVGVERVLTDGLHTLETNLLGTRTVLEAAASEGTTTVLTSSSEVYGRGLALPFDEDDPVVIGPADRGRWAYAASKLADESMAFAYHRERRLPVVVLRLFNVVGPRQMGRFGMVLPRFVEQALRDDPLTVYGDGTQTRTFCDVRDTVGAIWGAAFEPAANGRIFNVGSEIERSILDLAHEVIRVLDSRSTIRMIPHEAAHGPGFDEIPRRVPDVSRIAKVLGWTPVTPLADTITAIRDHITIRR